MTVGSQWPPTAPWDGMAWHNRLAVHWHPWQALVRHGHAMGIFPAQDKTSLPVLLDEAACRDSGNTCAAQQQLLRHGLPRGLQLPSCNLRHALKARVPQLFAVEKAGRESSVCGGQRPGGKLSRCAALMCKVDVSPVLQVAEHTEPESSRDMLSEAAL